MTWRDQMAQLLLKVLFFCFKLILMPSNMIFVIKIRKKGFFLGLALSLSSTSNSNGAISGGVRGFAD